MSRIRKSTPDDGKRGDTPNAAAITALASWDRAGFHTAGGGLTSDWDRLEELDAGACFFSSRDVKRYRTGFSRAYSNDYGQRVRRSCHNYLLVLLAGSRRQEYPQRVDT